MGDEAKSSYLRAKNESIGIIESLRYRACLGFKSAVNESVIAKGIIEQSTPKYPESHLHEPSSLQIPFP